MRASSSLSVHEMGPDPQFGAGNFTMARLENFLDAVLNPLLCEEMQKRETAIQLAAQCTQLRVLFDEMKALSRSSSDGSDSMMKNQSSSIKTSKPLPPEPQRNHILVNLGNHFYTSALVKDARTIWLNIGAGVVLQMPIDDAKAHLVKRERIARESLERQNQQILRLKFRIRLVTEAIKRLHEKCIGVEGIER